MGVSGAHRAKGAANNSTTSGGGGGGGTALPDAERVPHRHWTPPKSFVANLGELMVGWCVPLARLV